MARDRVILKTAQHFSPRSSDRPSPFFSLPYKNVCALRTVGEREELRFKDGKLVPYTTMQNRTRSRKGHLRARRNTLGGRGARGGLGRRKLL